MQLFKYSDTRIFHSACTPHIFEEDIYVFFQYGPISCQYFYDNCSPMVLKLYVLLGGPGWGLTG